MPRDCAYCDNGWTPVCSRPLGKGSVEEIGPCPNCEAGQERELNHWGPNGYWQGRPHNLPRPEAKVFLSKEENAKRVRELMATIGLVAKEMAN